MNAKEWSSYTSHNMETLKQSTCLSIIFKNKIHAVGYRASLVFV